MEVEIKVKVRIDDTEKEMTIGEAKQLRDALNVLLGESAYPQITLPDNPYLTEPTPWWRNPISYGGRTNA